MSVSTPRILRRASSGNAASGCITRGSLVGESFSHMLGESAALLFRKMQAALGAPPQDILGVARPLLRDKILDFRGVKRSPAMTTVVGQRRGVTKDLFYARAVPTQKDLTVFGRQEGVKIRNFCAIRCKIAARQVSPRQCRAVRPCGAHARKELPELGQRMLSKAAIGRNLAAVDRQQRRCSLGIRIELEDIVPRYRGGVDAAVVVQRPHATVGPDDVCR